MPKNSHPEHVEDGFLEVMTSFADLICFIMALFMLLFVLSSNEQKKQDTFFEELRLQFAGKDSKQQEQLNSEALIVSKVEGFLKSDSELKEDVQVLVDEQKIRLLLFPGILFDSGSAVLRPEGYKVLDGIGKIMKDVRNPVIVEGHTDNIPIHTSQFDSNWELSFHRSYSVVKYLMTKYDFPPTQVSCLGFGEYKPITENITEQGRSKNRRIEINIIRVSKAKGS